jgi:hypothetical protein
VHLGNKLLIFVNLFEKQCLYLWKSIFNFSSVLQELLNSVDQHSSKLFPILFQSNKSFFLQLMLNNFEVIRDSKGLTEYITQIGL